MFSKLSIVLSILWCLGTVGCDDAERTIVDSGADGDADMDADGDGDGDGDSDTAGDTNTTIETDTEEDIASLVGDIERNGNYVLELTDGTNTLLFECGAVNGGLILKFALNGANMLAETAEMNGSIFWIAPQTLWGWPPPSALNYNDFVPTVDAAGRSITLTSEVDTEFNFQVVKRFTADLKKFAIIHEYTIINTGTAPASFAPWEVSRVLPGGVTFFPEGSEVNEVDMTPLTVSSINGISWLDHTTPYDAGNYKYCADGSGGWLAHAFDNMVFVKSFDDQPAALKPPDQGEIQLYIKGGAYEEVEQMGAYQEIPVGGQTTWTIRWFLRPVPAGSSVAVGDAALVDFVDNLVP